ncbi:MAG: DUF2232 domain-containing protein [Desulfobulbus sp.]|nr:DUF2232 domain-containing protein [Desulfobulbus sp.]
MTGSGIKWKKGILPLNQILLFSIIFFLPVVLPSYFGWTAGMLAVPVFCALSFNGVPAGKNVVIVSLILVGLVALARQQASAFLFSINAVPLGFVLFHSTQAGKTAARSGLEGTGIMLIIWLLFWSVFNAVTGIDLYQQILDTMNSALEQTKEVSSSQEAGLAPEMVLGIAQAVTAMQETVPKMLPGLLLSLLLTTVWLNMVIINSLMTRITGTPPWGIYSTWKLPEHLVWLPAGAIAAMLLTQGTLQQIGFWMAMIAGLLYFFQGLAVLMTLLTRWRVPPFIKTVLYLVCLLNTYGLLLLTSLGLLDVWFNLRKIPKDGT